MVDLLKQVDGAVSHGAKVLIGGKRIDRPGSYMEPTILTDIKPGNPAFREEFFGPVALFFRVKDENEAIALANDSRLRLGWLCLHQGTSHVGSAWPAVSIPA
ncbi:MAG: aldehyde dehydrogenase family protein [Methylovirgula sp.]